MADNIFDIIGAALDASGYVYRQQGSFAPDEVLPETFITYQVIFKEDIAHACNAPYASSARVQMALYSKDPAVAQSADQILKGIMLPAGFTRYTGRQLPYMADTGHYGYTCDYKYYLEEG
jgi:hypothetical protein